MFRRTWHRLRDRILGGLMLVLPILITLWLIHWLYSGLEQYLIDPLAKLILWQVGRRQPDMELPFWFERFAAPLLAILIVLMMLYGLGFFVNSRLRRIIDWIVLRVPGISIIYDGLRKVLQFMDKQPGQQRQQRMVLVAFPHPGMKVPAFVTGTCRDVHTQKVILCVYVPTTPVPTSGYFLLVPEEETIELNWTAEESLQAIISAGLTTPPHITYFRTGPTVPVQDDPARTGFHRSLQRLHAVDDSIIENEQLVKARRNLNSFHGLRRIIPSTRLSSPSNLFRKPTRHPSPSTAKDARRKCSCVPMATLDCLYWPADLMRFLHAIRCLLRLLVLSRSQLILENLALRRKLAILSRQPPRPPPRHWDRLFWDCLAKLYSGWRTALVLIQPQTVVGWHRQGFRVWWRWKSRTQRVGRPAVAKCIRIFIGRMARENPVWGAPRIRVELRLLGLEVAEATAAKYMARPRHQKPPPQTWKTFLDNHVASMASMDFFTVPTLTFRQLFVFVILSHQRRRVIHFNVTTAPTAAWGSRQLCEAFPFETAPRYLIRDRDSIYGDEVRRCLAALNVEEVVTAPRSPWQNPYCERLVGTLRCELLAHVIVLNERHLRWLLSSYLRYYHEARAHMGLEHNAPEPRVAEPPEQGHILAEPMVGGLHHRYRRCA